MMRRLLVVLIALVLLGGAACSGSDSGDSSTAGGADSGAAVGAPKAQQDGLRSETQELSDEGSGGSGAAYGGSTDTAGRAASSLPELGASVIKTADLTLTVSEGSVDDAIEKAIDAAGVHGGYVVSTEMEESKNPTASATVRVPAEEFESTLGDLKDIGEVRSERIEGRDVSEEFVDLQARLRNLESQEIVLLRLYDRAVSVADTIRIQRELQGVQLEIERHRGRLRFLEDRTSLSTITLTVEEPGAPGAAKDADGAIARAWQQAKEVTVAMVSALIVATGAVFPVAVLALLVALLYRLLRPRFWPSIEGSE